jgi:hypothetical protein
MAWKVKVEGEVIVRDGTGNAIEFYEKEFLLDDSVKNEAQARCLLHNGLISERLRKEVQGYRRWRTCQIVSFEKAQEAAEHSELDVALLEAIQLGCVPENIDNYRRPDYKLKALLAAIESHKSKKAAHKDNVQDQGYVD